MATNFVEQASPRQGAHVSGKMNWDKEGRRSRQTRAEARLKPTDIVLAFKTLSFYLRERDVDTRYVISIPYKWDAMSAEDLTPYFNAHKSGACPALRALKNANWCRISVMTAESVGMKECELCCPYSNL
jgi:hypothetical protein